MDKQEPYSGVHYHHQQSNDEKLEFHLFSGLNLRNSWKIEIKPVALVLMIQLFLLQCQTPVFCWEWAKASFIMGMSEGL